MHGQPRVRFAAHSGCVQPRCILPRRTRARLRPGGRASAGCGEGRRYNPPCRPEGRRARWPGAGPAASTLVAHVHTAVKPCVGRTGRCTRVAVCRGVVRLQGLRAPPGASSARRLCVNGGGRGIRFLAGRGGSGRTGGRSRQPSAAARSACAKACGGSGGGGTAQRHGTASMFKESHVHLDVVVSRHRSTRATRAARAARVFCRSRKHGPRVGLCRVLGLREWRARVHDDCCHMLVTGERASAAVPKSSRARAAARVHARASWSTDVLEPASCRGHGPVGRRAAPIAASS